MSWVKLSMSEAGEYCGGNTYRGLFGPPNGAHYASGCSGSREGMYDKRAIGIDAVWLRCGRQVLSGRIFSMRGAFRMRPGCAYGMRKGREVMGGYRVRRGMRRQLFLKYVEWKVEATIGRRGS